MGTNVYALKKNLYNEELYSSYAEAAKNKDENLLKDINKQLLEAEAENEVHIGKRSGGWKFLFNHNKWQYYDYSRESIDNFLKSCYKIVNEYGEEMTPEEFWKEYVDDMSKGFNGEQYCNYELERAKAKEKGELEDKYNLFMTVYQAMNYYEESKKDDWHEEQYCTYNGKNQKIPYKKLNYRFSKSTEFF